MTLALDRTNAKPEPEPHRRVCFTCMRPARVCWCAFVPRIEAATRVLILQHPREELMPIGTARMASHCLPGSTLVTGTHVEDQPAVRALLEDEAQPPILLWPGPGALDLAKSPPVGRVTLVVVDGTWSLAKKVVRLNPRIAALPRYAFTPQRPSEYRIRAEPDAAYVSTIEAVAIALGLLEGDPERFRPMLEPFRRMVDTQIEHQARLDGGRKRARPRPARSTRLPSALVDPSRVVVIGAEANAWPYRSVPNFKDELVQWVAVRLGTSERYEAILAPRNPLAPSTPSHTRLPRDLLERGVTQATFLASWKAFLRNDDVLAGWGHYAVTQLATAGGARTSDYVDLRGAAAQVLRIKPGSIDSFGERIGGVGEPLGEGRGGQRLAVARATALHLIDYAARQERVL